MKSRWILLIVVSLLIVVALVYRLTRADRRVEVTRPRVETIRAYVDEQATTELPQDYLISMPIAGWLEPISLREGDCVEKNKVVARLDRADLEDRVHQAEQRVAVLETKLKETLDHRLEENALVEARATVKAIEEMVQASERKLEAAKAVADFAQSEVERIKGIRAAAAAADRESREAETAWRKAQAEYQSDGLQLAAMKTLAAVSYIGPKFITDYIDRKTFTADTYKQQLSEARADLEIEKRNLQRAEITSPIDGVVLQRHQIHRQFLSAGTPLLTVGRLSDMDVIAEILTERAAHISPGDAVEIYGEAILSGPIHGKVTRIYPAGFTKISSLGVEQQRVKVAISLDKRPPGLGVAFRVQVRVYYRTADNALTLPRTALFRSDGGKWQVMVVRDGYTRLAGVQVGLMNDERVQITGGLGPNDQVVARPSRDIVENMRVEAVPLE